MNPRHLEILQHALGADEYGRNAKGSRPLDCGYYRNHFCAGGKDEDDCRELVALGFMVQHETTQWLPYFNVSVTDAGIKAMREASPKPPVLTRSQKRYRDFLESDGCVADTFGEYLHAIQQPWYKKMVAG